MIRKNLRFALLAGAGLLLLGCANKSDTASANVTPEPSPAPAASAEKSSWSKFASSTHTVTLPAGTVIAVRTTSTLTTKENHNGEAFHASLEEPLVQGQDLIAAKGADVSGVVADSDPGGRVKGRATLGLRLSSLATVNGDQAVTTNTVWHEAPGTKKKDAAKIGIGSGVGAVIGALAGGGRGAAIGAGAGAGAGGAYVLATRGDPAVVPAESVLRFRLEAPVTLEVKN